MEKGIGGFKVGRLKGICSEDSRLLAQVQSF